MTLEEAIRKIDKATGLTQEEIADKIGYSRSHLSVSIKKGGSKKLINALRQEFKDIIGNERITAETTYVQEIAGKAEYLGQSEERLIRLESYNAVILKVLADFLSEKTGKQSSLIEAELQEAIAKVSELRINALERKV